MMEAVMNRERRILLPGDTPGVSNLEFLRAVEGQRIPMRCGETIVGYVTNFRIEGECVVGEFRECGTSDS